MLSGRIRAGFDCFQERSSSYPKKPKFIFTSKNVVHSNKTTQEIHRSYVTALKNGRFLKKTLNISNICQHILQEVKLSLPYNKTATTRILSLWNIGEKVNEHHDNRTSVFLKWRNKEKTYSLYPSYKLILDPFENKEKLSRWPHDFIVYCFCMLGAFTSLTVYNYTTSLEAQLVLRAEHWW